LSIEELKIVYKDETEKEFNNKLGDLHFLHKLYLYIRHNFVQDILFKQSREHMDYMI
jgi:hypothetical protein